MHIPHDQIFDTGLLDGLWVGGVCLVEGFLHCSRPEHKHVSLAALCMRGCKWFLFLGNSRVFFSMLLRMTLSSLERSMQLKHSSFYPTRSLWCWTAQAVPRLYLVQRPPHHHCYCRRLWSCVASAQAMILIETTILSLQACHGFKNYTHYVGRIYLLSILILMTSSQKLLTHPFFQLYFVLC